jgi:predicted transcriptional regulator
MTTLESPHSDTVRSRQAVRPFVLSIRPTYIERILEGRKTIELRRRFPTVIGRAAVVLLYSTSPVQAIVGSARLQEVSQRSLRHLWREFGTAAAVTRSEFDAYFSGTEQGCALRLTDVRAFVSPIHLTDLAREFELLEGATVPTGDPWQG